MKKLDNGWEHIRSEKGPSLGLLKTHYDHLVNPRNQKNVKVLVIEGRDAVNVIAVTKEQKVVLTRQLRFGTQDMSIEPPGGLLEADEEQLTGAKRELREETGYTGSKWSHLTTYGSQPVFMDNYIHTYILEDAELTEPLELDEAEDIEIFTVTFEELKEMLVSGKFIHPHAITSVTMFLLRKGIIA